MIKNLKTFPIFIALIIGVFFVAGCVRRTMPIVVPPAPGFYETVQCRKSGDKITRPTVAPRMSGVQLEFTAARLGISLGRLDVAYLTDAAGHNYNVIINARAAGILRQFFSDNFHFDAHGSIRGNDMFGHTIHTTNSNSRRTRVRNYYYRAGAWIATNNGEPREIEPEVFEDAIDAITALMMLGHRISTTGNCNLSQNVFLDRSGFHVEVTDHGVESGAGHRCDIVFSNRAGRVQRDWPFAHEFARRENRTHPPRSSVYFRRVVDGGDYVPVEFRFRDTPIGSLDIRMSRFTEI